ncbi:TPM domain-containing protein [Sphingomonas sp. BT-65]|uniref:TPM domain-containing protein n=1 Tax=Sphingomonas sp. BT-65 TaxID=2989821 RepID=UPI002235F0DA|nr:TPM domain-containing protein [Sphingomonas sp. BT-65]MCW4462465.1 TPM domain-containing protein [Sphingomonas sp. BT-65]
MRPLYLFLALMLAVLAGTAAQAQTFPKLTGRVVDAANLLSPEQEAQLTAMSDATEKATGRQLVVATVPDLQDYPIEDFGYKLGRAWKIGQSEADNGIILLVAPTERKVRIEVGYGLEPIMTDALSGMIIRDTILPAFRSGDMGGGIVAGANAINEQLKLPLEAAEVRAKQLVDAGSRQRSRGGGANWFVIAFWIFVVLTVVLPIVIGAARGKKYRGGHAPVVIWGPGWGDGGSSWGGSSWGDGGGSSWGGGGGGFSGGGGSFGGGGASGGW